MSEAMNKPSMVRITGKPRPTPARLLTLKQAAEDLGLSVSRLRRAMWDGELAVVRLGRLVRIDRRDLEAWLERQKTCGPVI